MQSGYGEMQQFLVDGCAPTLFSISAPPRPDNPNPGPEIHTTNLKFHHQHQHHHQHHHHPPQFPHFHPIPITQQLFQQNQGHHQFELFHHHQQQQQSEQGRTIPFPHQSLGDNSVRENSGSPIIGRTGGSPSFLAAAMNFKLAVNDSSGDDDGSETQFHKWQQEEEPAIKEPFWRPLDIDYIDKRCKEKEPESSTNAHCKNNSKNGDGNNYKLFSELEAIYKPGNNQTGSGSALTGDETPLATAADIVPPCVLELADGDDDISDTSTGKGEKPAMKQLKSGNGRRKRKRRQHQHQLSSITGFLEGLVKQLMEHQEGLHRKFLEVMERRDRERTIREEAWRRQEAAKSAREAAARAQERALAADREAVIISFLEKITGESLAFPTKPQFQSKEVEIAEDSPMDGNADRMLPMSTSRWPRAEVQALIRVRSGLESRFQEPGLKGPLWEEVSSMMGSMGYHRSSKRCKEKWENINKYFRKTKDSGKKRPQQSKTCPYFHLLDQLYSKSRISGGQRDNSELLDAIVVSTEYKLPETEFNNGKSSEVEFAGKENDGEIPADGNEEGGDEEEEGESHCLWQQTIQS